MSLREIRLPFISIAMVMLSATAPAAQPGPTPSLDAVVITADRVNEALEAERSATPGAVTTLDGTTFNERSVTTVSDMLRYVPGIWAESYNGNDDVFYSSRGSNLDATDYDKNGVKFLQDGLPMTAADGNNHNRAIDPLSARYVTVAHGANALAYGASTLGGAIDVTSQTARTAAPFSVSTSAGSFGQWSGRATLGGVAGNLDGLVTAETLQRDGYRDHSKEDRKGLYANLGWNASDQVSTRFYATYSDFYAELPRELTPAQFHADPRQARADAIAGNHSKQVETWRLAFKTTVAEVAGGTLELGASHEQQSLYHPIVSGPFFSLLIDTDHKDNGTMLRYHRNAGGHDLALGANYGFSTMTGGNYQNIGGERGALMWTTNDDAATLELFALDRWNFAPEWTLVYGTQFVSADRDVSGFKGSYDSLNPRFGVIRNYGGSAEWFASASRVYEAPTTFELTDDAHGGGAPLDAMHGLVLETGLRGKSMRGNTLLNWEMSTYYTSLRNEILSIDDPDAPGTSLSANIDKTTHTGIEALLGVSFAIGDGGHRIEPLLSATFNAFSFDSDPNYGNNRLPAAPRWFARGEILYRHVNGFYAGPTFDFVGRRYVDFDNTWSVGTYGLLGLRAGFTSDHWEVFAEGRNLLGKEYVAAVVVKDHASPGLEMLHPGAPRAVNVGARYRF
jgi:iron complex outermembrane recepter protein